MNYDDIYYIEYLNDKLLIHENNHTYSNSKDFLKSLPKNFYYINPYTIVNANKITIFDYLNYTLTFDNGLKINNIIKKYNIF